MSHLLRWAAAALPWALGVAACAHVEEPPGGPEDRTPPAVASTRPDDGEILPGFNEPVVFVFDERISERNLDRAVIVSPRTSPVIVRHGRSDVRVSLREGWEPGRVYLVTLLPELVDLFGNRFAAPTTLAFSTGPPIPATRLSGTVVDRVTGRAQRGVRVEAIQTPDSLVYATVTDSIGRFDLTRIPVGSYLVRGFEDMNANRSLEGFEPRDTTQIEIEGTMEGVALRLLLPDSTAPVAGSVTIRQRRIEVEFDDYLDPDQELGPEAVTVAGPTGAALQVDSVAIAGAGRSPTAAGAPPERLPSRRIVIELSPDAVLEPAAEHTVVVRGLRNVNGIAGDAEGSFTTPPAPPQALVSTRRARHYIDAPLAGRTRTPPNGLAENGRK